MLTRSHEILYFVITTILWGSLLMVTQLVQPSSEIHALTTTFHYLAIYSQDYHFSVFSEKNNDSADQFLKHMPSARFLLGANLHGASLVAQMVRISLQYRRPGFNPWSGRSPGEGKWLPTPVFWPEEFQGQRSLVGYIPRGHKELNITEQPILHEDVDITGSSFFLWPPSWFVRSQFPKEGLNPGHSNESPEAWNPNHYTTRKLLKIIDSGIWYFVSNI